MSISRRQLLHVGGSTLAMLGMSSRSDVLAASAMGSQSLPVRLLRDDYQEDHFYIEQDEDHGDQVELHRETLARRAYRVLTTLVRHQLRSCSLTLSDECREDDVTHREACRDDEHQQNGQVVVKTKRHLKHTITNR